jgi:hypothetical protein
MVMIYLLLTHVISIVNLHMLVEIKIFEFEFEFELTSSLIASPLLNQGLS